ncbi:MAG: cell division protein FtsX, partial [Candidatus Binatia bacterium]
MSPPRPFYFFRRALRNLRGAPAPAVVAAATIGIAVLLFGLFLLTAENVHRMLVGWAAEGEPLTVYAARGLDPEALAALETRIRAFPGVERVLRMEPADALADLGRMLGEDADLLEGVEAHEVIGAIFSVAPRTPATGSAEVLALERALRRLDGVE